MASIKSADSRTASNAPALRLQISSQNVASPHSSTPTTATQRSSFPIKGLTPQMRDNFDFTLGSVWTADSRCDSGSTFVEMNEAGIAWAEVPQEPSPGAGRHYFLMGIGKADGRGCLFIRTERMNLHEIAQMLSQLYQRQLLAQNPGTSPRTLAMPVAAVHHTIVTAPKPPRWIANG